MKEEKENAALSLLRAGEYACVIVRGDHVWTTKDRGIRPLLTWAEDGGVLKDADAADRIVGKAAALLYVYGGARNVHGVVMSVSATKVFERFGVAYTYGELTAEIRNRTDTGRCPMEEAVSETEKPEEAPGVLRRRLEQLMRAAEQGK